MKIFKILFSLILTIVLLYGSNININFAGKNYFHRYNVNNQFEFTPKNQKDLNKWNDMITIVYYPSVKDAKSLASIANNLLGLYQKNGKVLRTNSVARTTKKSAEHFIASVLGNPKFLEFVQVRLKINNGIGSAVIYSHRIYGKKVGVQMSSWINENAARTESFLKNLKNIPSYKSLKNK